MRRPRALVLDEVWRGLQGVEALSGPHGGPLRRTVKLILDPLVIRPVQHPACAGAVLTDDGATLLAGRVHAAADLLRATAAWFTLLKQMRRVLRITEGNAQDLYFQHCFELATTYGHPDPHRDRRRAEATLREIHEVTAGRTTQALEEHLTDPATAARLAPLIETAWHRRPGPITGPDHGPALLALLDAAAARDARRDLLGALIAANAGTHTGIALWYADFGATACELGLTTRPLPLRPALGSSASTATLGLPFDRTVHERVFTVLRASTERAELPPIPDLVTEEIARSCAPWALLDESLRATAAAATRLAVGLAPIDRPGQPVRPPSTASPGAPAFTGSPEESAAHRLVNARWRREAYVLQARRLAVHTTPDAPEGRDPLTAIAAELHTPWRPYLRRLWVRLHGRDVRGLPVDGHEELWDLLDGVARSVILDHRTRVKNVLSATSRSSLGNPAPLADTSEPRAS